MALLVSVVFRHTYEGVNYSLLNTHKFVFIKAVISYLLYSNILFNKDIKYILIKGYFKVFIKYFANSLLYIMCVLYYIKCIVFNI